MAQQTELAGIYTDMAGVSKLKQEASQQTDASKREAAMQFESLFLQQMIKTMREAVPEGGLMSSDQMDMYQGMYDEQLSVELAKTGSIGIADLVYRQLGGTDPNGIGVKPAAPLSNTDHLSFANRLWGSKSARAAAQEPAWDSPESFIEHLRPAAETAARQLGTKPEAILAIAALETGWGSHVLKNRAGESSNNLFGIKADKSWGKNHMVGSTLEYENGAMQRKREPFRSYRSAAESVADFAQFIQENPRYRNALKKAADPEAFIKELHKAGYATDPAYAEKVNSVIKQLQADAKGSTSSADNLG